MRRHLLRHVVLGLIAAVTLGCSSGATATKASTTTVTSTTLRADLLDACKSGSAELAALPALGDFQSIIRFVGTIANNAPTMSAMAGAVAPDSPLGSAYFELGEAAKDFVLHATADSYGSQLTGLLRAYAHVDAAAAASSATDCSADAWGHQRLLDATSAQLSSQ